MRICQVVTNRPLRWHLALADLLRSSGHDVVLCRKPDAGPALPDSVERLFAFESIAFGRSGRDFVETVAAGDLQRVGELPGGNTFDLAVMLTGEETAEARSSRIIYPLFNGQVGEVGAVAALIEQKAFPIGIMDVTGQEWRTFEFPAAANDRLRIMPSLANVCSRVAETIQSYVAGDLPAEKFVLPAVRRAALGEVRSAAVLKHAAATLRKKIEKRLAMLARNGDRWAVGWRELSSDGPLASQCGSKADFQLIPDDGGRYFADPFLLDHAGATHLFVEEFDYATNKGVISVFDRAADGFGNRRVVLDRPYHLSYPFVFRDGDSVWMLPECGDTGRVELYRAVRYPDQWERAAVLIEGARAYDATLHRDDRGYWIFATAAHWDSSTCDRLVLFHSPALLGPWTRCGPNTELRDIRAARPAGTLCEIDGRLTRPTQDCHDIYGGAINLCVVNELDEGRFSQTVTGRIEVAGKPAIRGTHTYNVGGGLEVIDVFGFSRSDTSVTLQHLPATEPAPRESSIMPMRPLGTTARIPAAVARDGQR